MRKNICLRKSGVSDDKKKQQQFLKSLPQQLRRNIDAKVTSSGLYSAKEGT